MTARIARYTAAACAFALAAGGCALLESPDARARRAPRASMLIVAPLGLPSARAAQHQTLIRLCAMLFSTPPAT